MISLLAKLFLKPEGKSEATLRKGYGILCGAVGIGLNLVLFLLKFHTCLLKEGFLFPLVFSS